MYYKSQMAAVGMLRCHWRHFEQEAEL